MKMCVFCKKRRHARAAFTLIEMLLVSILFSVIGVVIASSFLSGMRIWDRVRNADYTKNDTLLSLEIIAKDFRQAIDTSFIDFEGAQDTATIATIHNDSIVRVTYLYDVTDSALIKYTSTLVDIVDSDDAIPYVEKNVINAIDSFSFSYGSLSEESSGLIWEDTWSGEDGVFRAVKISCTKAGNNFEKTIFIPIS